MQSFNIQGCWWKQKNFCWDVVTASWTGDTTAGNPRNHPLLSHPQPLPSLSSLDSINNTTLISFKCSQHLALHLCFAVPLSTVESLRPNPKLVGQHWKRESPLIFSFYNYNINRSGSRKCLTNIYEWRLTMLFPSPQAQITDTQGQINDKRKNPRRN